MRVKALIPNPSPLVKITPGEGRISICDSSSKICECAAVDSDPEPESEPESEGDLPAPPVSQATAKDGLFNQGLRDKVVNVRATPSF